MCKLYVTHVLLLTRLDLQLRMPLHISLTQYQDMQDAYKVKFASVNNS